MGGGEGQKSDIQGVLTKISMKKIRCLGRGSFPAFPCVSGPQERQRGGSETKRRQRSSVLAPPLPLHLRALVLKKNPKLPLPLTSKLFPR